MAHLPDGRVAVAAAESEIHYLAIDAIGVSRGAGAVSFRSGARATLVLGGVAVHSIDPTQPSIVAADTVGSPALLLAGEHLSESQMRLGTANGPAMAVLTADGSNIVRMETGDSVVLARQEDGSGYLVVSTERDRVTPGAILLPDASNGGAAVVGGTGLGTTAATGVSALGLFALAAGGGFIFFGGDEEDSSGGTVEVPELAPSLPDSSPISVNKVNR
jgi:hypothetical protein